MTNSALAISSKFTRPSISVNNCINLFRYFRYGHTKLCFKNGKLLLPILIRIGGPNKSVYRGFP